MMIGIIFSPHSTAQFVGAQVSSHSINSPSLFFPQATTQTLPQFAGFRYATTTTNLLENVQDFRFVIDVLILELIQKSWSPCETYPYS